MTRPAIAADRLAPAMPILDRALETEFSYFEMGARTERLDGAVLAWTPAFVHAPAASVVHRVDPNVVATHGLELRLAELGIGLARIYLTAGDTRIENLLLNAGFACREELVLTHSLPDPPPLLTFRPVRSERDWALKQEFHEKVAESPDGHVNRAADLVGLERHKCAHGMDAFLGELDGRTVGVVGAIWGKGVARIKNLLIHPDYRRQSAGTWMLEHVAALGRARGINEQCLMALKGGAGEMLYRSLGMQVAGSQFEWSKRLGGQ
jgi:GNAT superfamily N-acetyltransferase